MNKINYIVASAVVSMALALSALASTSPSSGVKPSHSPSPRKAEIQACNVTFKTARQAYKDAVKKANQDLNAATKSARNIFKSSDKGQAARDVYKNALKAAQDTAKAAREAARTVWKTATDVHNMCVRDNPSPSPTRS